MFNENDFIKDKYYIKKYHYYCDKCGKDRGYLPKNLNNKETSKYCITCTNSGMGSVTKRGLCKYCNKIHPLPPVRQSNEFWYWSKNKKLIHGGIFICRQKIRDDATRWRKNNPEKSKEKSRKSANRRRFLRPEDVKKSNERWRFNNKEKVREAAKRAQKRMRLTPHGRLRGNLSALIRVCLYKRKINKKYDSKIRGLSWSIEDLIKSLESKFQAGMTWENYGKNGWEIDHVIPDSWFDYEDINDSSFKSCWSLDNLQPQWASKNRSKGNKFIG